MIRIGFICPTYKAGHLHNYTQKALESFLATTPGGVAIVVDDASADWQRYQGLYEALPRDEGQDVVCIHFAKAGGLTRSWNAGLQYASELGLDFAIAGNNDIIFPHPQWSAGMLHALTHSFSLVGPLSNAPGITAKGAQEIDRYVADYKLTDDPGYLSQVGEEVYHRHLGKVIESPVNGFFQMASMASWEAGRFSDQHYYRPLNTHTSKGRRNPTPTMTLNEDELQARWAKKGMKSAVALSSFIFHYRAVSRGDKYKRGKWYRQA